MKEGIDRFRLGRRQHLRRLDEAEVGDLDGIAARLVEADGGTHQGGDAVELLLGARLVDDVAIAVARVDAVDHDGDGEPTHAAGLDRLGRRRARNLVVQDLLEAGRGLLHAAGAVGDVGVGQFVADGDAVIAGIGGRGLLLARLAGAQDAAFGVE